MASTNPTGNRRCPCCGQKIRQPPPSGEVAEAVKAAIDASVRTEWSIADLARAAGVPADKTLYNAVGYLAKTGKLRRVFRGIYQST